MINIVSKLLTDSELDKHYWFYVTFTWSRELSVMLSAYVIQNFCMLWHCEMFDRPLSVSCSPSISRCRRFPH